ncbi:MAG: hypothetical protein HY553_03250 [Elusimicrobia bacterium]|nr:hypothetical protein [Elusimicrobiota bacterium]
MSFLQRVAAAFRESGVDFAVAGGYAVALHGVVRGTLDIDVVLRHERGQFLKAERALSALGLAPRLPVSAGEVFGFRREYIEERSLKAWTFVNPSNPAELVDVVITHDLKALKTKQVSVGGDLIPIVAKRDLIAMKRAAGRRQDLEDIRALEAA